MNDKDHPLRARSEWDYGSKLSPSIIKCPTSRQELTGRVRVLDGLITMGYLDEGWGDLLHTSPFGMSILAHRHQQEPPTQLLTTGASPQPVLRLPLFVIVISIDNNWQIIFCSSLLELTAFVRDNAALIDYLRESSEEPGRSTMLPL